MQAFPWLSLALLSGTLGAQTFTDNSGSGSVNYFSESRSDADGGAATSTTYAVIATIGAFDPAVGTSVTYALSGGFIGTLDAVSTGPWVTAANPGFALPRGNGLLWLNGARLHIGEPTVTVSGVPAAVVAKSPTDVGVQMPNLLAPGWHEVKLANNAGTTSLERGVGVLPMLFTEGAAASEIPFDLVFKGSKGDTVFWALGFSGGPPIPIPNYLHGLTLSSSFIRVLPMVPITDDSGEFRMSIPSRPFAFVIFAQALFLTSNPGYSPGSFSNMLTF